MTYIAPRTKALAHLDRLASWQQGDTPAPVTVEWDLTNVCSLGCQACHFAHTHVRGPLAAPSTVKPFGYTETGQHADAALVYRGLTQMAEAGVKAIVWSGGGEPTLHPEWPAFVEFATACGLEQGMYTLGGHLTPDTAQHLGWHAAWVVVSLDAVDGPTYAAEKRVPEARFVDACDGIARLSQHRAVVGVSFLLHAGNWREAEAMRILAQTLGATYATFRPAIHTSPLAPSLVTSDRAWVTEALPTLRALGECPDVEIDVDRFIDYRDWTSHGYATCHGIKLVTMVTPDGRVWACPNRRGVAGSELGDLRDEDFAAIWARHPSQWTVDAGCRAMCRLHLVNQSLVPAFQPHAHEAFV